MDMGVNPGEVVKDEQGIRTMQVLGLNTAWPMKELFR